VPIILRIDGRAFIKDLEKRVKVARLEKKPTIIETEQRR
jgi:hypothetical protein